MKCLTHSLTVTVSNAPACLGVTEALDWETSALCPTSPAARGGVTNVFLSWEELSLLASR